MSPFFIVGPPKTGTTVLTRLLVQHPEVTCISESYVLDFTGPGSIAHPGGEKWSDHGFSQADAIRWNRLFQSELPSNALRTILTEAWATMREKTGAKVAGDSWPFYGLHLPVVAEAFPDAKYIYTTRDPRAVYWSGETFMGRNQGSWNSRLLLHMDRKAREFFSNRDVYVVQYEELVAHPEAVLKGLWSYLGADPDQGWVDYDVTKDPWPRRWSWIPNATKPLDPSRTKRFEQEMPQSSRRFVDLAAAEYATVWDYPLTLQNDYRQEEYVAAFTAGALLDILPPGTEDLVRSALCLSTQALREHTAAAARTQATKPGLVLSHSG